MNFWDLQKPLIQFRIFAVLLLTFLGMSGLYSISNNVPAEQRAEHLLSYIQDDSKQLDYRQVRQLDSSQWQQALSNDLKLGISDEVHWFKLDILAQQQAAGRVLEIAYPTLDKIELWLHVDDKLVAHYLAGDLLPFSVRAIEHPHFVFPLPDVPGSIQVLLQVQTEGSLKLPVLVWQSERFFEQASQDNLVMGVFIGFLLAMVGINLFFFFAIRNLTFLVYAGFVVSVVVVISILNGVAYQHLWPNSSWLQSHAVPFFAFITSVFGVVFSYRLLGVKGVNPLIYRIMRWWALVLAVMAVSSLLTADSLLITLMLSAICATVLMIVAIAAFLSYRGSELAINYSLTWLVLLLSALLVSLDNFALISLPWSANYLLMASAGIESVLVAVLFALSFRQQQKGLHDAQQDVLEQEKQANIARQELIDVQREASEELEYKVQERTLELEIALRELSEVNNELEKLNASDALTGVHNRRHFDKRLLAEARRSRREQTTLSLAMVDIDSFKQVNDEYGHPVGDECLRFVAGQLKSFFKRTADQVCRYGGEEFAVIMPNTDLQGAQEVVEAVRHSLQQASIITAAGNLKLTISAGISCAVIQQPEQELAMLNHADQCLYKAKQAGRNRVFAEQYLLHDQEKSC